MYTSVSCLQHIDNLHSPYLYTLICALIEFSIQDISFSNIFRQLIIRNDSSPKALMSNYMSITALSCLFPVFWVFFLS